MKYNVAFVEDVTKELLNYQDNKNEYAQFSLDLPDGFSEVPVLEICKSMYDGDTFETKERISRHCILGKKVIVLCDNKPVGSFIMNNLTDRWDAFEVIVKYPIILNIIFEVCQSHILKKSTPPRRDIKPKEEA